MGRRRCGASKPCSLCSLKRFRRNRSRLDGEKGKGESAARQTPASSHTFRCGQYLRPLRKATGFDRDIYGYEPPGIAGGGLPSAFASSMEGSGTPTKGSMPDKSQRQRR